MTPKELEKRRIEFIVEDVLCERERAIKLHGDGRKRGDGINGHLIPAMEAIRTLTDIKCERGEETWTHILAEEFLEAVTEPDPDKLEAELIQVAATCLNWIAAIRRRRGTH